jgi:AP-3 complex subunit delta-1
MSLLYECINGIIQGGILDSSDDSAGGEAIATLCVSKLRGMIMIEGDPNRRSPPRIPPDCSNKEQ